MRFHLSDSGTLSLREPMDFKRLDVLIDPQPPEAVERAIRRIGQRESETHVRLAPSVLRFVSGHAGEPEWEEGFARMLDYAQRNGWVDEQGQVRAHISHGDQEEVVSIAEFKTALRALPAGICAVSTGQGDQVAGMIVSSLTAVCAEPPMIGFFAHRQSSFTAPLLESGRFAANVLGEGHDAVMAQFLQAPQGLARFSDERWHSENGQAPVLADALASMECDVVWTQELGTHVLVVGKVRRSRNSPSNPVVHFNAATHRIAA